ncbi:probable protein-S-isoprenylcysteine O-methyltransferase [Impatiens glandulifera]|uniref:probable protein-S-isoprenylcysteine O-methyltransferase n=1 Tax=Impatiens glandulifera TaxID=253017 RepID=UPI001FB0E041|nr:probable protein-S-isoprenylcysteine O-methyltransferase [Impatiens glandulifera]
MLLDNYTAAATMQLSVMFAATFFFFHASEYILAVIIHGRANVGLSSLLISKQYIGAMLFSLMEFYVEVYLFPGMKEEGGWRIISKIGLGMVIIGEVIRKMAILTAGRAFTHLIKIYHEQRHQLVIHGVYGKIRHPGYLGFLIWSVGTQVMLCNPISTLTFTVVVWNFFANRIPYEEYFLRQFFGGQYDQYAATVPSGIPFVK